MAQLKNMSKAERYKWSPLDKKGDFKWINKRFLVVPTDEYQRSGNKPKELRIASKFSWSAFQVISVASRPDGMFNVIEGGHRFRAALMRDDITEVPCLVFDGQSQKDQAAAFVKVNSDRKPMRATDKHKAYLVAGDELALKVQSYIDWSGRKVGHSATESQVSCIIDIRKCIDLDEPAFRSVWPVIVDLCQGHPMHQAIVSGLFYIERNASEPASSPRINGRLLQLGYDEILMAGKKGRQFHGSGAPKHFAEGIIQAINKGLRNRVEMK